MLRRGADHVWALDELVNLLEAVEAVPMKRGQPRKRQPTSN
jgi:hypothetical protein